MSIYSKPIELLDGSGCGLRITTPPSHQIVLAYHFNIAKLQKLIIMNYQASVMQYLSYPVLEGERIKRISWYMYYTVEVYMLKYILSFNNYNALIITIIYDHNIFIYTIFNIHMK